MERTQFELGVGEQSPTSQPRTPVVSLQYSRAPARLRERLTTRLRADIRPDEIDVTARFRGAATEPDAGVLALTDRVTGAFILEAEVTVASIREVVRAIHTSGAHTGEAATYELRIRAESKPVASFEADLLLVYDSTGTLHREASLLPTGVEL